MSYAFTMDRAVAIVVVDTFESHYPGRKCGPIVTVLLDILLVISIQLSRSSLCSRSTAQMGIQEIGHDCHYETSAQAGQANRFCGCQRSK